MKIWLRFFCSVAVVALLVFASASRPASAEPAEAGCFNCEEWMNHQFIYYHNDYTFPTFNTYRGPFHGARALGPCSIHIAYSVT